MYNQTDVAYNSSDLSDQSESDQSYCEQTQTKFFDSPPSSPPMRKNLPDDDSDEHSGGDDAMYMAETNEQPTNDQPTNDQPTNEQPTNDQHMDDHRPTSTTEAGHVSSSKQKYVHHAPQTQQTNNATTASVFVPEQQHKKQHNGQRRIHPTAAMQEDLGRVTEEFKSQTKDNTRFKFVTQIIKSFIKQDAERTFREGVDYYTQYKELNDFFATMSQVSQYGLGDEVKKCLKRHAEEQEAQAKDNEEWINAVARAEATRTTAVASAMKVVGGSGAQ
jgi:hypothetical protein